MIDKDFVAYKEFGNSREYPLVKKKHVLSTEFIPLHNLPPSLLMKLTNLSAKELEELKKKADIQKKKNDRLNQINRFSLFVLLVCYHLKKCISSIGSFYCLAILLFTIEIIRETL
jgi:hypothetical protein